VKLCVFSFVLCDINCITEFRREGTESHSVFRHLLFLESESVFQALQLHFSSIFGVDEKGITLKKEEFKSLFDTYFEDVRRYILYRSGNDDIATDIAQETFMRIWEKQIVIDPKRVKGLLFKIAGDLFVSQYRREQVAFNFFNTFQPNDKSITPEDEINFKELTKAYDAALKSMPEKQRTVFLMNRIEELKYKEIADQLGLSVKAIEKRMGQALEHLKIHLKDKIKGLILFALGRRLNRIKMEINK